MGNFLRFVVYFFRGEPCLCGEDHGSGWGLVLIAALVGLLVGWLG